MEFFMALTAGVSLLYVVYMKVGCDVAQSFLLMNTGLQTTHFNVQSSLR